MAEQTKNQATLAAIYLVARHAKHLDVSVAGGGGSHTN